MEVQVRRGGERRWRTAKEVGMPEGREWEGQVRLRGLEPNQRYQVGQLVGKKKIGEAVGRDWDHSEREDRLGQLGG